MIYLDNNATTPLDPRVLEAMNPYFNERFGNPSSNHELGWQANSAVVKARRQVAQLMGAKANQIYFSAGATESNHLVIQGILLKELLDHKNKKNHFITTSVEHKCILEAMKRCQEFGAEVTIIPVNSYGQVSVEQVEQTLRPETRLVSVMFANNEVGSINPIAEIGALCKKHGVLFHTDAAQAFGKVGIDVEVMNIDFLSISAHKIYGPKGVGALYCKAKPDQTLKPLISGGGQEFGLRAGTLNVSGIVGLGKAADLAKNDFQEEAFRLKDLSDVLLKRLYSLSPKVQLNGDPLNRLPGNLSLSFIGLNPDLFDTELDGLCFSTSSACGASDMKGSYVLAELGLNEATSLSTLRLGLGRFTTEEEVSKASELIMAMLKS